MQTDCHEASVSKVRHLDGRCLWIQEKTADNTLQARAVHGRRNPADVGTKAPASQARLLAFMRMHDTVQLHGNQVTNVGEAEHDAECQRDHAGPSAGELKLKGGLTNP